MPSNPFVSTTPGGPSTSTNPFFPAHPSAAPPAFDHSTNPFIFTPVSTPDTIANPTPKPKKPRPKPKPRIFAPAAQVDNQSPRELRCRTHCRRTFYNEKGRAAHERKCRGASRKRARKEIEGKVRAMGGEGVAERAQGVLLGLGDETNEGEGQRVLVKEEDVGDDVMDVEGVEDMEVERQEKLRRANEESFQENARVVVGQGVEGKEV